MQQAVQDGTVTPLLYEERITELSTNDEAIDAWFDRITDKLSSKQRTDLKRKFSSKGQIYQVEGRLELIAHDISDHFQNFKEQGLKGQLACDSKASAIVYKLLLDEIGKVTSVVAMSPPDTREGHDDIDTESKDKVQNWWNMLSSLPNRELTYWLRQGRSNNAEIDYVIALDGQIRYQRKRSVIRNNCVDADEFQELLGSIGR